MAGRPGRSGGHNRIDPAVHLLRGTFRPGRHGPRPPALPAVSAPPANPIPAAVVDGLSGRGRDFVEAAWQRYSGWTAAALVLLRETGQVISALEQLRGERGERQAQRMLVQLLAALAPRARNADAPTPPDRRIPRSRSRSIRPAIPAEAVTAATGRTSSRRVAGDGLHGWAGLASRRSTSGTSTARRCSRRRLSDGAVVPASATGSCTYVRRELACVRPSTAVVSAVPLRQYSSPTADGDASTIGSRRLEARARRSSISAGANATTPRSCSRFCKSPTPGFRRTNCSPPRRCRPDLSRWVAGKSREVGRPAAASDCRRTGSSYGDVTRRCPRCGCSDTSAPTAARFGKWKPTYPLVRRHGRGR